MRMKAQRHDYSHEGITIPIREIRPDYFMVDKYERGKRTRKCFPTLKAAEAEAHAMAIARFNDGASIWELTAQQREDAQRAYDLLDGRGSLVEAAEAFKTLFPPAGAKTVEDAATEYMALMVKEKARPASIKDKEVRLRPLRDAYGARPVQSLVDADLKAIVRDRGWSDSNAAKYRAAWQSVIRMASGNRRAKRNGGDERIPPTFDPGTVRRIMAAAAASCPEMIAHMGCLFFAGIRPDEVLRLDWKDVDFKRGVIRLRGEQTKTRRHRTVDIEDNLREWLLSVRAKGALSPNGTQARYRRLKIMEGAGIDTWPNDVARHTYATAHYNLYEDAGRTAKQLGHFESLDTFVRHYNGQMDRAEAEAFFSIRPGDDPGKVIPMEGGAA